MPAAAPPVFLDRDGTLIVEKHYLRHAADVCLESGVVQGLATLQRHGHALVVLSNQSGISRGMFAESEAWLVNERVAALLRAHGIEVLAWYICPHAPEADCDCRKPRAGMARNASQELNLELSGSYVIGDKRSDVELADAIGATGILLTTGQGAAALEWARQQSRLVFADLSAAADYIVQRTARAGSATRPGSLLS